MKLLAVLLGPAGIGLFGLYNLVADLAASIAGMGVQASGVRQVAAAVASGDEAKSARTITVLKWVSLALAIIGGGLVAAAAVPIANLTFGTSVEAPAIVLVGVAVTLRLAAAAPTALIQGSRRIADLAWMAVLGAVLNTATAVPLVYFLGRDGIVPSLIAVALTSLLAALWYSRKIATPRVRLTGREWLDAGGQLFRLGFAFMMSALLTFGSAYLIRIFILQLSSVEAAGFYQAAWAIGGLYAGFILQAMGTDFYPRLTGVAHDNSECNRLVNEQAQVSILLAGPGVVATMTLAPLVMTLFYSAEFAEAVPLLRWICLGMLLRIVAWPMGFIVLAKSAQWTFFWTEIAAAVVQVGLAWVLLRTVGVVGAGIAFFGLYVWHGLIIYVLVRRLSGFRWSQENLKAALVFLATTGVAFPAVSLLPFWPATIIGAAATCAAGLYSIVQLAPLLPEQWVPLHLRRWLIRSPASGTMQG